MRYGGTQQGLLSVWGYINGVNYACEENAANTGIYKFVDNKLYYWTPENYNAATKFSPKNATGSMNITTRYWGQVSGAAAKELDEMVFVLGVYAYNGTTYTTVVMNYQIGIINWVIF